MTQTPTAEQATQIAIMIVSGMPSRDAIRYFTPPEFDAKQTDYFHDAWMRSKTLADAILAQYGQPWQGMTLGEKLDLVISKSYTEMAYYLYSNNMAELTGPDLAKAQAFRVAIEQKLAGQAGKLDALSQFWDDLRTGRVNLQPQPQHSLGRALPVS